MARIHPTAVVEKGAQLDEDVVIGPYSLVGSGVSIGAGTVLDARVVLVGATKVGRQNRFYPNSVVGCCPQVMGMDPNSKMGGLVIGDRNVIRENVTIHPSKHEGTITEIGSDNLLMIGAHVGHDVIVEDNVVLSNCVQIAGHVKVERGAWISGMAASHQFVTIGKWCFVAGMAGLTHDVPPFLIVSGYPPKVRGVNKRGLQRAKLSGEQQEQIRDAYKKLYRQGSALLTNARELSQQDGLDENVRDMVDSIFRSAKHRFGRYRETLRG